VIPERVPKGSFCPTGWWDWPIWGLWWVILFSQWADLDQFIVVGWPQHTHQSEPAHSDSSIGNHARHSGTPKNWLDSQLSTPCPGSHSKVPVSNLHIHMLAKPSFEHPTRLSHPNFHLKICNPSECLPNLKFKFKPLIQFATSFFMQSIGWIKICLCGDWKVHVVNSWAISGYKTNQIWIGKITS
jgi:hypothetical protein